MFQFSPELASINQPQPQPLTALQPRSLPPVRPFIDLQRQPSASARPSHHKHHRSHPRPQQLPHASLQYLHQRLLRHRQNANAKTLSILNPRIATRIEQAPKDQGPNQFEHILHKIDHLHKHQQPKAPVQAEPPPQLPSSSYIFIQQVHFRLYILKLRQRFRQW